MNIEAELVRVHFIEETNDQIDALCNICRELDKTITNQQKRIDKLEATMNERFRAQNIDIKDIKSKTMFRRGMQTI